MQTVLFQDLGHMDYQEAWDYQTGLHRGLVDHKLKNRDLAPDAFPQNHHLLLVEHPPVFTLGKSGSIDNLLLNETELRERGIQYFPINRGGDITFHGPGQIVGYPILDLDRFFNDVHRYVRALEEVIIRTLAEYQLEGFRIEGYTGVWVKDSGDGGRLTGDGGRLTGDGGRLAVDGRRLAVDGRRAIVDGIPGVEPPSTVHPPPSTDLRKICAIGVHLSRWVTLHGWAFNVNTPLEYFRYIVPCGIADDDKTVTSLEYELGRPVDLNEVKNHIKRHFCAVFECQLI